MPASLAEPPLPADVVDRRDQEDEADHAEGCVSSGQEQDDEGHIEGGGDIEVPHELLLADARTLSRKSMSLKLTHYPTRRPVRGGGRVAVRRAATGRGGVAEARRGEPAMPPPVAGIIPSRWQNHCSSSRSSAWSHCRRRSLLSRTPRRICSACSQT